MTSRRWRGRYGPPTMWARGAGGLLTVIESLGGDRALMLARSGLTEVDFADPDGRVPLEAVYTAIEVAVEVTGDHLLGVHAAKAVTDVDLDAMGFLVMTSRTMGEAIERMDRYSEAFVTGERYKWFLEGNRLHHQFVPYGQGREAHRQLSELIFYDIAVNGPNRHGPAVAPIQIRFTHDPSPGVDYSIFGVEVAFAQPHNEAIFPAEVMDAPIQSSSPAMADFVNRFIEGLLDRVPAEGSLVALVIERIDRTLDRGAPTVHEVAADLAMSSRSLQRQLRVEGTTLTALVDGTRKSKALSLIEAGVSLAEVAYLVGYADQAVFHRAFKRWTETTPSSYRAAASDTAPLSERTRHQ